jgi:hypothetical protein
MPCIHMPTAQACATSHTSKRAKPQQVLLKRGAQYREYSGSQHSVISALSGKEYS